LALPQLVERDQKSAVLLYSRGKPIRQGLGDRPTNSTANAFLFFYLCLSVFICGHTFLGF
jgi:hypothetical protein